MSNQAYFLGRHIERNSTEINFAVVVSAREHEEDAGTPGGAFLQATKPEYDSALVFLHHLEARPNAYWQSYDQKKHTTNDGDELKGWAPVVIFYVGRTFNQR